MEFHGPHIRNSSNYLLHKLELSNAVLLLAKLLLESDVKAGTASQKSPTVQKPPPLPYPSWQLHKMKACVRLDQVDIQHARNEWSSITSPGLSIIGLSS